MNDTSLTSNSSFAGAGPLGSDRRLRFAALFLFATAWFLWLWIPKGAPSGFFERPSFAAVVNGESGPDDPKARCEPNCRFHHRWPDGRTRAIHSALVTAYHDEEWASLSFAESWIDPTRLPSIPRLCPKRMQDDRILDFPSRVPSSWQRRDALLEDPRMIPHSAFFVMGEGPFDQWRDPIALVTEVGDFGSYRLGSGSGALVEHRKSGTELHCVFNSDLQVRGGMSFISTQWREDPWNLVSVEVLITRPDGRKFSISAEGPAPRMIEELPGLRSFIDSLLDAP